MNRKARLIILTSFFFILIFCLSILTKNEGLLQNEPSFTESVHDEKNIDALKISNYKTKLEWNVTWQTFYSDSGRDIELDSLDNIFVLGYTGNGGTLSILIKFDNNGLYQWSKIWKEHGDAMVIDSNDYIYIVGRNNSDILLMKFDKEGNSIWNQTWDSGYYDYAGDLALDSFGNIWVTGYANYTGPYTEDIVLLRFNSSGHLNFSKTWGGPSTDYGLVIALDSLNNVYLAGKSDTSDLCLVKFNYSGDYQWYRKWGGIGLEEARDVAVDASDNVYIVGDTSSFGDPRGDACVVKYNSSGFQSWNAIWDLDGRGDLAMAITVDSKSMIHVVGYFETSYSDDLDVFLTTFNQSGACLSTEMWERPYEGLWCDYYWDLARDVVVDEYDNIFITGNTDDGKPNNQFDLIVLKYDNSAPRITVNAPNPHEVFGDIAPDYVVEIVEANLNAMWYTINEEDTKRSINTLTGTINQDAWSLLKEGTVKITFWVDDTLGNLGFKEVSIVKKISANGGGGSGSTSKTSEETTPSTPEIPIETILLVGGISGGAVALGVIVYLLRKRSIAAV